MVARLFFIFCFYCMLCGNSTAQVKTDTLKEATIKAKTQPPADAKTTTFAPGQKITQIDSTTLKQYNFQSLATLLTQQVPVFIRSYGFNGLATLNFRGSSAAQSAVLWNGVPIQNAALGIADISTLPAMLMSKVSIVYGGSAALLGSGNVGGALMLETGDTRFDSGKKTLTISAATGSFGQFSGGIDAMASGKKWCVSARAIGQQALNNFPYTTETGTMTNMTNSRLHSIAGIANAAYKTSPYSTLTLSLWLQRYYREIPPAIFESQGSDKRQNDASMRLLLSFNKSKHALSWYAKSSFILDKTVYDDAAILLHSAGTVNQYFQEAGIKLQMKRYGQLLVFAPLQLAWMNPIGADTTNHQLKTAIATAYEVKLLHNRLDVAGNVRAEAVNGKGYVLPGINAAYSITHWLTLTANVQRTLRVPSLNELYYFPGGNIALKPEQGWSQDAGYNANVKYKKILLQHSLSAFNRNIQDWIIWLGGAVWTPHNIAEVHSRGIETENRVVYTPGRWRVHLGLNTAYVLATTEKSYIYNDGSTGRQIPYSPRYNGQMNIGATFKTLYFNYNHTYTGYRFTVADESRYLAPYATGNLQAMYATRLQRHPITITAQCNNLWNRRYQVVDGRPLPGTNWLAGIKYDVFPGR